MTDRPAVNILWFKRDLRLRDHAPLQAALNVSNRPLLLVYFFEPEVIADPNYDQRHWRFVSESLADLNQQLSEREKTGPAVSKFNHEWLPFVFDDESESVNSGHSTGIPHIWIFHRSVLEVFDALHQIFAIDTISSYEETGLKVTYDRDKAVARFCRQNGICWREFPSNGVIRGLKNRETWADDWQQTMRSPQQHPDLSRWKPADLPADWYQTQRGPNLPPAWHEPNPLFQPGGERNAFRYLNSFLVKRISLYARSISKPLASRRGCSRLSPYLAWGCLSIRQVFQAQLTAKKSIDGVSFRRQFDAFASRLRWHCHFIQKFESEDRMEFQNINRAFDGLQKNENQAQYRAWRDGQTGYPLVDACMRCLKATGYINFRMRAMLMSFLSHHLFQHWQEGAWHLARLFTDFEPGIHYAQVQMQTGMTGTNTVRIYNPVKQSLDHDPEGVFIRQWVPELVNCPLAYLHEPWQMPPLEQIMCHFQVGINYPAPIIDTEETGRRARLLLYKPRETETGQAEIERILMRHTIPMKANPQPFVSGKPL